MYGIGQYLFDPIDGGRSGQHKHIHGLPLVIIPVSDISQLRLGRCPVIGSDMAGAVDDLCHRGIHIVGMISDESAHCIRSFADPGAAIQQLGGLGEFTAVAVEDGLPVTVLRKRGAPSRIDITADGNLLDRITYTVTDGTLTVATSAPIALSPGARIKVVLPFLDAIAARGGSVVAVEDVDAGPFEAVASGGANLRVAGFASEVRVTASGGVASIDHLRRLADLGVEGTIVGRAIYEGAVDLAEAVAELWG